MAWLTRCSQFEFDDRQMYFLSLQLSSVNCLETTLLVKLAIDSLVSVQHKDTTLTSKHMQFLTMRVLL